MSGDSSVAIGVDIGGTFTDAVLLGRDGTLITLKFPTRVGDLALNVAGGVGELLKAAGRPPDSAGAVVHGTTLATNTILEFDGARTGLITTQGFRDVLELRRIRMPELYNLRWDKPRPLVPRRRRREVRERVNFRGEVLIPLDLDEVRRVVGGLVEQGVESLAVCLHNSYANPAHERAIGDLVRRGFPDLELSLSVDVLPEIREYERTSTTVVNAYIKPVMRAYMASLVSHCRQLGVRAPLLIMRSGGGVMTAPAAAERPVHIVESGPAAGVIAARRLAAEMELPNVITFDMGGTTAKASIIEDGRVTRAPEFEVGGGMSMASRFISGGGYTIRIPVIDIAEVGAGGGSLVVLDEGGALRVGPRSAGASPGPVCYGAGGEEPTVTDANLLLGYLNPRHLIDGGLPLDRERAAEVFQKRVADPLHHSLEQAAYGVHQVASANMIRAIRSVSTERGRDPRE